MLHLSPSPSGRSDAWISLCLFLTILVAEKFWTLVERSRDPCAPVPLSLQPGSVSPSFTANVLTMHPAQLPDSDPSLFSARRLQLSLCFECKNGAFGWCSRIEMQGNVNQVFFVVTQLSSAATPLGQCGCELWVSSNVATIKDLCLLHADPRILMVTLPLHGSTSLAIVLHAPDRHYGEDAISVWWQETLDLLKRLCPSRTPVIAMIDANAEVGSEVSPSNGNRDGNLLWRFVASFLCRASVDSACHSSRAGCPDGGALGGTPQVTGEELISLLFLCIGCRPAPMRTLGNTVSLPFRIENTTGLLRWMFLFESLVLVIVSTEISLPGEHSSSQTLLSAQKPFGGLCQAGPSIGTLTGGKLLLPSWLASFLQLWFRLERGAQKQIRSRQTLGQLLSSTENVGITSL